MSIKNISINDIKNFLLVSLLSLFFSLIWIYVGEKWEVLADGTHYMLMYDGHIANSPFGFRILTPWLASILPWDAKTSFTIVTLACLSVTTGILLQYISEFHKFNITKFFVFISWVTSFPFIYYGTTLIRADALMLLIISLVILLSKYNASSLLLFILLSIGTLSHEMVMIVIPFLLLDKFLSGSLSGGSNYSYRQLFFITLGTLIFFIAVRLIVETNISSSPSYLKSPVEMFTYVVSYSGGFIKHLLRMYASFGPIFLFSILYLLFIEKNLSNTFVYIGTLILVFLATFLATDTLRVMAIFYFPIIIYASYFLTYIWKKGLIWETYALVSLQLFYSYIVYLHLRTFESSSLLNIFAASISLVALLLSFWAIKKGK